MKKILFILLFSLQFISAQEDLKIRKQEVRLDVFSLIFSSKWGVSYDYLLNNNYTVGMTTTFSNNAKINDDFDLGIRNNVPKYEIIPYLRYNLSKGLSRYYFAEVFTDFNGGDYKEIVRLTDESLNGYYTVKKSTYSDIALGFALGYKMYFEHKIALEFIVGFGKNITNTSKSPDYVTRVGLNLGYRF